MRTPMFVARGVIAVCLLWSCGVFAQPCRDWPMWREFSSRFIQMDGRVLADESERRYSSSEGQAYALFFTLVANDRITFDRVLNWTRDNLAAGDLGARLPAWQWGKRADGVWGVVDNNSASDADSWLAYSLLEAGRLWHEPRYTAQGRLILANIRLHALREFPDVGAMLLPGQTGFDLPQSAIRVNPSYIPVQLWRVFIAEDQTGSWATLLDNQVKLLGAVTPKGFVPDWAIYQPGKGYQVDKQTLGMGQHDAIRVYLWWGMLSRQDPLSPALQRSLSGMNSWIPQHEISPPLSVDTQTGVASGISPVSFSAALLPYFSRTGNKVALRLQRERLLAQSEANSALLGHELRYYDQVLGLFGLGWMDHRFSFSSQGQLVVPWKSPCSEKK